MKKKQHYTARIDGKGMTMWMTRKQKETERKKLLYTDNSLEFLR